MATAWIKFYPSDWLSGTRGMTPAETGIYITLVAMMYENEGPLGMDKTRLARLCGTTGPNFRKALDALIEAGKITETPKGLYNDKVAKVLAGVREIATANSKSASKRWAEKANENNEGGMRAQCERNAIPEARSQKPDKKPPKPPEPSPQDILSEVCTPAVAADIVAHRQDLRKPITARAAKAMVTKLRDHPAPDAVLQNSIMNGWQGIFPEKVAGPFLTIPGGKHGQPTRQQAANDAQFRAELDLYTDAARIAAASFRTERGD